MAAHLSAVEPEAAKIVQSMWEVPGIAQFCSLFRSVFGHTKRGDAFQILDPEIDALEIALASSNISDTLIDLHIRLLRGYYNDMSIAPHNWVKSLRRYVAEAFPEHENILGEVGDEDTIDDYRGYESLTIVERVKLLHHICVARVAGLGDYVPPDMMNKGESRAAINALQPAGIRDPEEPLGYDAEGSAYWYFSGIRLYKETAEVVVAATPKKKGGKKGKGKKKSPKRKADEGPDADEVVAGVVVAGEADPHPLGPQPGDERWSCVCQSVQDWEDLLPVLKTPKRNTPQYDLHKLLSEEFVPPLKEQWEKEEKKRQKEAMWASVPRRISSRQVSLQAAAEERERLEAIKAAQAREEAEKKAARDAAKAEERKRLAREERAKERERARLEEAEERARRKEKRRRLVETMGDEATSWIEQAVRIHVQVMRIKSAWPFLEPVSEEIAPGYFEMIQRPMDLGTVKSKLEAGDYLMPAEYYADVILIFANCREYNQDDDEVTRLGNETEAAFREKFSAVFPDALRQLTEPLAAQPHGHGSYPMQPNGGGGHLSAQVIQPHHHGYGQYSAPSLSLGDKGGGSATDDDVMDDDDDDDVPEPESSDDDEWRPSRDPLKSMARGRKSKQGQSNGRSGYSGSGGGGGGGGGLQSGGGHAAYNGHHQHAPPSAHHPFGALGAGGGAAAAARGGNLPASFPFGGQWMPLGPEAVAAMRGLPRGTPVFPMAGYGMAGQGMGQQGMGQQGMGQQGMGQQGVGGAQGGSQSQRQPMMLPMQMQPGQRPGQAQGQALSTSPSTQAQGVFPQMGMMSQLAAIQGMQALQGRQGHPMQMQGFQQQQPGAFPQRSAPASAPAQPQAAPQQTGAPLSAWPPQQPAQHQLAQRMMAAQAGGGGGGGGGGGSSGGSGSAAAFPAMAMGGGGSGGGGGGGGGAGAAGGNYFPMAPQMTPQLALHLQHRERQQQLELQQRGVAAPPSALAQSAVPQGGAAQPQQQPPQQQQQQPMFSTPASFGSFGPPSS